MFSIYLRLRRQKLFDRPVLVIDASPFKVPASYDFTKRVLLKKGEKKEWVDGCEVVFAHIIDFDNPGVSMTVGVEPIRKGEGESKAALRLFDRVIKTAHSHKTRFFAVVADRYYNISQFFRRANEISEGFVTMLKEDMQVLKDAYGMVRGFSRMSEFYAGHVTHVYKRSTGQAYEETFDLWDVGGLSNWWEPSHKKHQPECKIKLRVIIARGRSSGVFLYYVTTGNDLLSTKDVVRIYRSRWRIETLFQRGKCRKHFGGVLMATTFEGFLKRLLLKFTGICLFLIYMRFRRRKLDKNSGVTYKSLIREFLLEIILQRRGAKDSGFP